MNLITDGVSHINAPVWSISGWFRMFGSNKKWILLFLSLQDVNIK